MFDEQKIAVVIPCFNEEILIKKVIETMPDYIDIMYVVDDVSTDNTEAVIIACAEQDKRVQLLKHNENQGVGGAIATGYKQALNDGYDVAVVMAGDAQMDPSELPDIIRPITQEGYDYSKGNRLFTGDAWNMIPKVRYLGNSALSLMTKISSGYWKVADSQSGYTAISKYALSLINWDKMYKRYGQPNDLLVRLNIYNLKVKDVTIKPIYGVGEKSGIKPIRMIPPLFWLLYKLFWYRMFHKYVIRDFHPLVLFYVMAHILLAIGGGLGIYLIAYRLFEGPIAGNSALFAAFSLIMGMLFLLFGMLFDMEDNRDLK
ncbi:MAG: glycosyltransferase family 2 protein [gamma proteobacterium symbiont of Bathyaustriella thionipta]|nr:glycosyltransferase family 2 protein [gamma proteobacterium symbiont of Bathyaustriella thionipta]MCU7948699.1 glycosyltransferase family 2 protein [gamma proteobacterium symbiont of Bathyaustriella thionipta]MCU7953876.1 glycosyltransferase family 2 protein [gamma proteobacterium symbiont of Bathyaustriella thionipta]MCU7955028.1 glycosyltransferase family 2 protein [gamma proteobacterium symbiont of Bathyaustriella thionipta]MCU7968638.1 glycosyltransferase family 2 protein [gamma proteoba